MKKKTLPSCQNLFANVPCCPQFLCSADFLFSLANVFVCWDDRLSWKRGTARSLKIQHTLTQYPPSTKIQWCTIIITGNKEQHSSVQRRRSRSKGLAIKLLSYTRILGYIWHCVNNFFADCGIRTKVIFWII